VAAKPPTVSASKANQHWDEPVPSASGGAGAAVAFAQAQVGKPYCYAGAGPDCYDCSGLTMRAWQAGGLSLPHFSGAQGSMFPRVPVSQLQPGDLITTSSWGAHVGIWVGGGYVHATHTGDFIKYVAGSGSVVDAVRPG
jgi:cell wall-associated NlpC family hydrolase